MRPKCIAYPPKLVKVTFDAGEVYGNARKLGEPEPGYYIDMLNDMNTWTLEPLGIGWTLASLGWTLRRTFGNLNPLAGHLKLGHSDICTRA